MGPKYTCYQGRVGETPKTDPDSLPRLLFIFAAVQPSITSGDGMRREDLITRSHKRWMARLQRVNCTEVPAYHQKRIAPYELVFEHVQPRVFNERRV